ncbi:MAG: 3-dehydroquinate synthase [Ruminococcaceae bacterium]|nr:3-dehydroquinate synthase [Oscillospiraceae bacterium]
MIIPVKTSQGGYNIVLERGALKKADEYLDLNRKVLVVTDSKVPEIYAKEVASRCREGHIVTIKEGEASKNIETFKEVLAALVEHSFTRTDCVVAVGGGVVGDLSGFVAASFMRGIDFYNIPTTVLSQVDSSIGGKTAIDFMGIKNIVGAFYPPKVVIIDPDTLKTLDQRQISNGLAEAVKMAATSDSELFELFEKEDAFKNIDTVINKALLIKKSVVEEDEKEAGLRKILNFGHTLAHAIESVNDMQNLYHGECVSLGMLAMCSEEVRERLEKVLKSLKLPTELDYSAEALLEACRHDKKTAGDSITVVYVEKIGKFELKTMKFSEYEEMIRQVLKR